MTNTDLKHPLPCHYSQLIGKALGVNSEKKSEASIPKTVYGCIQQHHGHSCGNTEMTSIRICFSNKEETGDLLHG